MRGISSAIPADFRGAGKRLDDIDIPTIAAEINTGEDELRALIEVESRGHGFDSAGRPVILFEPHIFYRLLGKGKKRDRAVAAGLAYPNWGEKPYPRDSYPRLARAMEIDRTAALQACSWGLPQILGSNFKAAGFTNVEAMVAAFCADEEHHLRAMVAFLVANGLDDDLRARRWPALARGYNGPGYAKHGYHTRLAAAFARWQKKPDISLREAAEIEQSDADAKTQQTFVDVARVKAVQERLIALGYHMVGKADGAAGPRTAGAIAAFQAENGFPVTGTITDELVRQLEEASPHVPSPERAEGVPEDSRVLAGGMSLRKAGGLLGSAGLAMQAGLVLDQVEQAKAIYDRVKALVAPIREIITDHWPVLLLISGGVMLWHSQAIIRARVEDYRTGRMP